MHMVEWPWSEYRHCNCLWFENTFPPLLILLRNKTFKNPPSYFYPGTVDPIKSRYCSSNKIASILQLLRRQLKINSFTFLIEDDLFVFLIRYCNTAFVSPALYPSIHKYRNSRHVSTPSATCNSLFLISTVYPLSLSKNLSYTKCQMLLLDTISRSCSIDNFTNKY